MGGGGRSNTPVFGGSGGGFGSPFPFASAEPSTARRTRSEAARKRRRMGGSPTGADIVGERRAPRPVTPWRAGRSGRCTPSSRGDPAAVGTPPPRTRFGSLRSSGAAVAGLALLEEGRQ